MTANPNSNNSQAVPSAKGCIRFRAESDRQIPCSTTCEEIKNIKKSRRASMPTMPMLSRMAPTMSSWFAFASSPVMRKRLSVASYDGSPSAFVCVNLTIATVQTIDNSPMTTTLIPCSENNERPISGRLSRLVRVASPVCWVSVNFFEICT